MNCITNIDNHWFYPSCCHLLSCTDSRIYHWSKSSTSLASKYYRKSDSKRRPNSYNIKVSDGRFLTRNTRVLPPHDFFSQYAQGDLLHWLSLRRSMA